MAVLQDFEALTPNLLARTIETVEGGGMIILLLKTVKSLKQLYTISMDVHARFRTEAHHEIVPRFNERFILSLGECSGCLVLDDELNILPISGGANMVPSLSDGIISSGLREVRSHNIVIYVIFIITVFDSYNHMTRIMHL
jgi:N-acetyltransferase 10